MEVFKIIIQKNDISRRTKVHGKISLDKGVATEIYERSASEADEVPSRGFYPVVISDEDLAFAMDEGFTIVVDLKDEDGKEFCKERYDWYNYVCPDKLYKLLENQFEGELGSVTVQYAMYWTSVSAKFSMTLNKNKTTQSATEVHGVVFLTNDLVGVAGKSFIFAKNKSDGVEVLPDGMIPVSKPCVAVPLQDYCNLTVRITCETTEGPETFSSTEIVEPLERGKYSLIIHGSNGGEIEVEVEVEFSRLG